MTRLRASAIPAAAAVAAVPIAASPGSTTAHVSYLFTFASLVVLCWTRILRSRSQFVGSYLLIAGTLSVWLAGDVLYEILSATIGLYSDVTPSDFLWVAGDGLLATGVIRMSSSRAPGHLRESLLDALAMTTVVAALFWQFLVGPALADGLSAASLVVSVSYPICDVALFAGIAVLVFSPGRWTAATGYLVSATGLKFLGDTAISVCGIHFPEFDSGRLASLLLISNALMVAALWHPRADQLTDSRQANDQRLHPARVIFLGLALLALPTMAYLRATATRTEQTTMLIAMTVLTCIILIRFFHLVRGQERARAALAVRATHDQLTGLLNRSELHVRLAVALRHRAPGDIGPGVLFLDLDGFKLINDRHGHAAGDRVLTEVAGRIRATTRAGDTVARLGGDEFVVMTADASGVDELSARLGATIREPIDYHGVELHVRSSFGAACAGDFTAPTEDSLLAADDAAMYRAKSANRAAAGSSGQDR